MKSELESSFIGKNLKESSVLWKEECIPTEVIGVRVSLPRNEYSITANTFPFSLLGSLHEYVTWEALLWILKRSGTTIGGNSRWFVRETLSWSNGEGSKEQSNRWRIASDRHGGKIPNPLVSYDTAETHWPQCCAYFPIYWTTSHCKCSFIHLCGKYEA